MYLFFPGTEKLLFKVNHKHRSRTEENTIKKFESCDLNRFSRVMSDLKLLCGGRDFKGLGASIRRYKLPVFMPIKSFFFRLF